MKNHKWKKYKITNEESCESQLKKIKKHWRKIWNKKVENTQKRICKNTNEEAENM